MAQQVTHSRSPSPSAFMMEESDQPDSSKVKVVESDDSMVQVETPAFTDEPSVEHKPVTRRAARLLRRDDVDMSEPTPSFIGRKRTERADDSDDDLEEGLEKFASTVKRFMGSSEGEAKFSASNITTGNEAAEAGKGFLSAALKVASQVDGGAIERLDSFISGGEVPESLGFILKEGFSQSLPVMAKDVENQRSTAGLIQMKAYPYAFFGSLQKGYACPVNTQAELVEVSELNMEMLAALCNDDKEAAVQARDGLTPYRMREGTEEMAPLDYMDKNNEALKKLQSEEVLPQLLSNSVEFFVSAGKRDDKQVAFSLECLQCKLDQVITQLPIIFAPLKAMPPAMREFMGVKTFPVPLTLGGKTITLSGADPDNLIAPLTALKTLCEHLVNKDYDAAAMAMADLQKHKQAFDSSSMLKALEDIGQVPTSTYEPDSVRQDEWP